MTTLTTLNVHVLNLRGIEMFQNPRFLRVVNDGSAIPTFAVARHGKALIVVRIASPDSVVVDPVAPRIDLSATRAGKLSDIGLTPVTKPVEVAVPGDLAELVAKYTATVAKQGRVFLQNALTHTRDPIKREAMEIALGHKQDPAKLAPIAMEPEKPAKKASKKPAVNVADLAKAIEEAGKEGGDLAAAFLKALEAKKS